MKLDAEEREILASVERGEWRPVKGKSGDRSRYAGYAKATFRKDRRVNIRISSKDLEGIQKRRPWPTASLLLALGCGNLLLAQTAQDFTKIYDSYLAAVKAGSYSQASPLLSKEVHDQLPTPAVQGEYMEMVKQMVPTHYELESVNVAKDGQSADVNLIITIAVPEEIQKQEKLPPTQSAEEVLKFVKEGGQWKMGPPLLLGDPDQRARPKDLNMGSRADYADGNNTEVGGPILRLDKQAAGTVFVLRLTDQEIAVFVPAAKVSPEFVPGSILVVHGAENKNDKLKVWAIDAALYQEPASK